MGWGAKEDIINPWKQINDDPQARWDGIRWMHESDDCEKMASMIIHHLVGSASTIQSCKMAVNPQSRR